MKYRELVSKYESRCGECGEKIDVGDVIYWRRGSRSLCASCYALYGINVERMEVINDSKTGGVALSSQTTTSSSPSSPSSMSTSYDTSTTSTSSSAYELRQAAIVKSHEDNLLSAELTRNCVALLITAVNQLTAAMNERTAILKEQLKGADR